MMLLTATSLPLLVALAAVGLVVAINRTARTSDPHDVPFEKH